MGGNSIQNNELPLAAQDAQRKNPVVLYVSECGDACDAAKGYLNKRGIRTPWSSHAFAGAEQKFKEQTGGEVVPVIRVGEKRLSGWSESVGLLRWTQPVKKTPAFAKTESRWRIAAASTNRRRRSPALRLVATRLIRRRQPLRSPLKNHHLER